MKTDDSAVDIKDVDLMGNGKRVVHITTVHHPYDPRIFYKQCMSLKKAKYDVYLIAQKAEHEQNDIKHIPLQSYTSRWKRMILGTMSAYKKAKRLNADIYVFHDPELMLVGALLKKRHNIVIYDIHEDYVTSILQKNYIPRIFRTWIAKIYKLIEKILTRNMELCLAEKYYKDLYGRGTCILNYPLINENLLQNKQSENKMRENKVLYTGNVTVDRGALIHAKIPKIDPNVSVQFIGKCPRSLADKIYEVAGNQKDQIHLRGIDQFIVKDEIEAMYHQHHWLAGIALFPPTEHYMKKELTKFFEYMNAGLPIICSNFPVWKKFIETYKCGIAVDPYNEEEIKNALNTLRNNPQLANEMGKNGRKAVQEELNWLSEERKLLDWYEQLLERKG